MPTAQDWGARCCAGLADFYEDAKAQDGFDAVVIDTFALQLLGFNWSSATGAAPLPGSSRCGRRLPTPSTVNQSSIASIPGLERSP